VALAGQDAPDHPTSCTSSNTRFRHLSSSIVIQNPYLAAIPAIPPPRFLGISIHSSSGSGDPLQGQFNEKNRPRTGAMLTFRWEFMYSLGTGLRALIRPP
jgi:hypothetical protein